MGNRYTDWQAKVEKDNRDLRMGLSGWNVPSVWGQIGYKNSAWRTDRGQGGTAATTSDGLPAAPRAPSQPFLPGVDRWLESVPFKYFALLGLIGGLGGFGYGMQTGGTQAGVLDGIAFGFAGLILLHALAKLFKLVIGLLMLGIAGGIVYLIYMATTH